MDSLLGPASFDFSGRDLVATMARTWTMRNAGEIALVCKRGEAVSDVIEGPMRRRWRN